MSPADMLRKAMKEHRSAAADLRRVAEARPVDLEALRRAAMRAQHAAAGVAGYAASAAWVAQRKVTATPRPEA